VKLAWMLFFASAAAAQWQQVVDAAKKEGTVVFYSAAVGAPATAKIQTAFKAKYGITMEVLQARSSELTERIRTEQVSGKRLGDVSHNGASVTERQLAEGVFMPYGTLPSAARLASSFPADGTRVPVYVIHFGILANTSLVKTSDEPKSWQDLLDPKWKGKILSDDMRALGSGSALFTATHEKFGRQFHERLAAQQPEFTRDVRGSQRRIARGEYPLFIPFNVADILTLKGLPVKFIVPSEGAVYVVFDCAILKGAPHPNAARLLLDFMLSDEVQLIYASTGYGMAVGGLDSKLSPEMRQLSNVKLLGTSVMKLQDKMLELAQQIYH
jgi:iron(III) transport system substrate-binding protein